MTRAALLVLVSALTATGAIAAEFTDIRLDGPVDDDVFKQPAPAVVPVK